MDPLDVPGNFTGSFTGAEKCESLCKIAAGVCRSSVKSALSCQKDEAASYWKAITLGICAQLEGVEKTSCLNEVKGIKANQKAEFADDKSIGLSGCDAFLDNCVMGCSEPL